MIMSSRKLVPFTVIYAISGVMDMKRISGAVLVVMAVVVAVHTIVEPLYYTSTEESPYSPAWGITAG